MASQQIRQCYYTHWKNEQQEINGWHTKARSPGLSEEHVTTKALSYFYYTLADPGSDPHTHPVALRYIPINTEESMLICIHSTGKTEDARTGNIFVHALFLPPTAFKHCPPIFYWDSPFWKKRDDNPVFYELATLPSLTTETVKPGFYESEIWEFLDKVDPNRHKLYQLVCAVIHKERMYRPIIILEQPAQVAKWIAALSLLLPPEHYRLLSFSTYNNKEKASANLQSNLFIIGLANPPERSIRTYDYRTYMIFDPAGQISPVEPSSYAERVISFASRQKYPNIRPFFEQVMANRNLPTYVGQDLEAHLKYEKALTRTQLQPTDWSAFREKLRQFELSRTLSTSLEEQEQLDLLRDRYWQSLEAGELTNHVDDLWRVLKLYPTITSPSNGRPSRRILGKLLNEAMRQGPDQARQTMKQALDLYYPWELAYVFSNLYTVDQQALTILADTSATIFADYWWNSADLLDPRNPDPQREIGAFLAVSLCIAYPAEEDQAGKREILPLKKTMLTVMKERQLDWLQLALQQTHQPTLLTAVLIRSYYFDLIGQLRPRSLEERIRYRQLLTMPRSTPWGDAFANLWQDEIENDIKSAIGNTAFMLALLETWVKRANRPMKSFLLEKVKYIVDHEHDFKLRTFKQKVSESSLLAEAILPVARNEAETMPFVQQITAKLFPSGKPSSDEQTVEDEVTELERQFRQALADNQLTNELCQNMHRALSATHEQRYHRKIAGYLQEQFKRSSIRGTQHALLVMALFVKTYQTLFWEEYLKCLKDLFFTLEKVESVRSVLKFWYDNVDSKSIRDILKFWQDNVDSDPEYVRVEFYGEFPSFISDIKEAKKFKEMAERLYPLIKEEAWYTHSVFQQNFKPVAKKTSPLQDFFTIR